MPATAEILRPHPADDRTSEFFHEMVVWHRPIVLATVINLVRDRDAAEDIAQETFLRAWRHIGCLDPTNEPTVRGWLLRVARNIAIDAFRAKRVRPTEVDESAAWGLGWPDPADAVVRVLHVRAALARLTDAHASVVRECYFHGRTVTETAESLGIPAGTVKSRLFGALRKLRELLETPGESAYAA